MRPKLKKLLKNPELVFVSIAVFFGLLSALLLPVLEAPDENQHFQVEYAIFSSSKHVPKDMVLSEGIILAAVRDGSYSNYFHKSEAAANDSVSINTSSYVFDGKTKASVFDIMRLPQAAGILIGRIIYPSLGFMTLVGRLASLSIFVTGLYFIIKKVRYGKWAFVFIACLPIVIQQAASLSYDSINLLAIFAWVAFIINLTSQKTFITRRQAIIGCLLAIFLLLTKANNILLLLLIFGLPFRHFMSIKALQKVELSQYRNLAKYAAFLSGGMIFIAGAYLMARVLLDGHHLYPYKLITVLLNTFFWGNLSLIDVTVNGMVGEFSNYYYHLPIWSVVIALTVLAIIMLYEKLPDVSRKFATISGLLFFGSILLISIALYYGWAMKPVRLGPSADVTDGIQGRYFAPLLILLFPMFAYFQKFIKIKASSDLTIPVLAASTSSLLLIFYLVQTWHFFWR